MKKLILFGIIALLSALTVFASSVSLADTLEMGSGSYGPQNISTPNTTVVVCDVNHETGFVTISSSLPGPAVVIITSQTTQETTQVFFHGEVALFVPPHEEYTIVIILANGATFSGSFNVY